MRGIFKQCFGNKMKVMLSNSNLLRKRQVLFGKLLLSVTWPVRFYLIRCSLEQVVFHVSVGFVRGIVTRNHLLDSVGNIGTGGWD